MIVKMPNVDARQMPELERYIREFATRYEYRLDGSSLWEGRARVGEVPEDVLQELVGRDEGDPLTRYWSRMLSYPKFRVPCGFTAFGDTTDWPSIQYHNNDTDRAIIALQDSDVFVVQHPTAATYEWELERIREAMSDLRRPRDLLAGHGFTASLKRRRSHTGAPVSG